MHVFCLSLLALWASGRITTTATTTRTTKNNNRGEPNHHHHHHHPPVATRWKAKPRWFVAKCHFSFDRRGWDPGAENGWPSWRNGDFPSAFEVTEKKHSSNCLVNCLKFSKKNWRNVFRNPGFYWLACRRSMSMDQKWCVVPLLLLILLLLLLLPTTTSTGTTTSTTTATPTTTPTTRTITFTLFLSFSLSLSLLFCSMWPCSFSQPLFRLRKWNPERTRGPDHQKKIKEKKSRRKSLPFLKIKRLMQVVPGRAGGGRFRRKKNYIAKKEVAYRMCARWPTIAMSKLFFWVWTKLLPLHGCDVMCFGVMCLWFDLLSSDVNSSSCTATMVVVFIAGYSVECNCRHCSRPHAW